MRTGSYNKKLVKIAAGGAEKAGAAVTYIDLKDYPLPLYDQDIQDESGIPENGIKLKGLFKANDGFIISSPEYNSAISGVLKNVIDWASRSAAGEEKLECFRGKTAVLMSASTGGLGGLRGLFSIRYILQNIGVMVIPEQIAVSRAGGAFNDEGNLIDQDRQSRIEGLGRKLAETAAKLKS